MGWSWTIDEPNDVADTSADSVKEALPSYRTRAPRHPGKVLRLQIEIPAPTLRSAVCLLPIIALHLFAFWVIANNRPGVLARVVAPIAVDFLIPLQQEIPPEPPMLPAAALEAEIDPLLSILPPSVAIDAFESESAAISAGFVAPKKAIPEPAIAEIVEEEDDGSFVRPRPIRGRTGKQRYPPGAAAALESGRVTMSICITARGTVASVEIIESTGYPRLDNDALQVARQYQFQPATRNGKPIPVCMPYSINYRIK